MRSLPLMFPALLALAACTPDVKDTGTGDDTDTDADTDTDTDTDTDADTDTDTDADTDADTDTDTDVYLDATGTFDGESFTVTCDATTPSYLFLGAASGTSINLICTDMSSYFGVAVALVDGGVGTYTTCSSSSAVQVVDASSGAYVACALSPATSFQLDVTEYAADGTGAVTWGGTFQMTAGDGTHTAEVSGSFRGVSSP